MTFWVSSKTHLWQSIYYYRQNSEDNESNCSDVRGPEPKFNSIIQSSEGNYFFDDMQLVDLHIGKIIYIQDQHGLRMKTSK